MTIVGRPGNGPGEFSNLRQIAVTEDESGIFAWDASSRIQVFAWRDSTYGLERTFQVDGNAYEGDMCLTNDHLFVIGYREESDAIINKYSLEGVLVTSFGARYDSPFPLLNRIMSRFGGLECDAEFGVVVHVNHYLPVISGYAVTGDLVWRVKLDGYKSAAVEEIMDDGSLGVSHRDARSGASYQIILNRDHGSSSVIARYWVKVGRRRTAWHLAYLSRGHAIRQRFLGGKPQLRQRQSRPAGAGFKPGVRKRVRHVSSDSSLRQVRH